MTQSNGHPDSAGDDSAERIRRHMRAVRAQMAKDADEVVDATRTMTDWRAYVRRYPWLFVGGAAVLGYALVPRKPAATVSLDAETLRRLSKLAGQPVQQAGARPRPTLLGSLVSTLVSVGARYAMQGVSQYIDQRRAQGIRQPEQAASTGASDATS